MPDIETRCKSLDDAIDAFERALAPILTLIDQLTNSRTSPFKSSINEHNEFEIGQVIPRTGDCSTHASVSQVYEEDDAIIDNDSSQIHQHRPFPLSCSGCGEDLHHADASEHYCTWVQNMREQGELISQISDLVGISQDQHDLCNKEWVAKVDSTPISYQHQTSPEFQTESGKELQSYAPSSHYSPRVNSMREQDNLMSQISNLVGGSLEVCPSDPLLPAITNLNGGKSDLTKHDMATGWKSRLASISEHEPMENDVCERNGDDQGSPTSHPKMAETDELSHQPSPKRDSLNSFRTHWRALYHADDPVDDHGYHDPDDEIEREVMPVIRGLQISKTLRPQQFSAYDFGMASNECLLQAPKVARKQTSEKPRNISRR